MILRQLSEVFHNIDLEKILMAIEYLSKYGYISNVNETNLEDILEGLIAFQKMAGLHRDGVLGPKTLEVMSMPRCSHPDFTYTQELDGKIQRMEVEESRWAKNVLTYYIEKRDNDISASVWDAIMDKGFQQWEDVADLNIKRTGNRNSANFVLSTGYGRKDNFDGQGGTLAWAYLPNGNRHTRQLLCKFDTSEAWNTNIMLLNVACHEFGHLLGLRHSSNKGALMAPFYSRSITKPQSRDDIPRMQSLYGRPDVKPADPKPPTKPPTKPTPPQPKGKTVITIDGTIDKITIPGYRITKIG